jgi:hypothetical protein
MKSNLTISSVGDISFSTGMEGHNYNFNNWASDEVLEYLDADIQIGNLECVFYPHKESRPPGFNLTEEDISIAAILKTGFNVLTLANNHISDYYQYKGIKHTIRLLKENNIHYCGAGIDINEAQKPAIIEINGHKVGIFSRIHEGSFENIKEYIATDDNPGAAPLDVKEIVKASGNAKLEYDLDIVILAIHWGIQDIHNHTSEIHKIASSIVKKSDVDIILGSHSHCIQGVEVKNNKVICYGQGNFYFYPQILEDGVLYDDSQDINRTSLLTRFNIDNQEIGVDAKVVRQDANNTVNFINKYREDQILKKVFGIWKDDRKIAFYFEYRLQAILLDFKKLIDVFRNPIVRQRFFKLIFNPSQLSKKIWVTFFTNKFK